MVVDMLNELIKRISNSILGYTISFTMQQLPIHKISGRLGVSVRNSTSNSNDTDGVSITIIYNINNDDGTVINTLLSLIDNISLIEHASTSRHIADGILYNGNVVLYKEDICNIINRCEELHALSDDEFMLLMRLA